MALFRPHSCQPHYFKMMMVLCAWLFFQAQGFTFQTLGVDPKLPHYQAVSGISGHITSIGSDSLSHIITQLSEQFRKYYPNTFIQVDGKGSGAAPPALVQGAAQLGPMSRLMKEGELRTFEYQWGFQPTPISICLNAVGIFVNYQNPLKTISLEQIDAAFSQNRRGGYPRNITNWGQLIKDPVYKPYPVRCYGRNSASGTYGYFKKVALFGGDFLNDVKEYPSSSSVILAISQDPYAIGYASLGYQSPGAKLLKVVHPFKGRAYLPTVKNVINQNYPLSRELFIYILLPDRQAPPAAVREFLLFALSQEGQEIVVRSGGIAIDAALAARQSALISKPTSPR